MFLKILVPLDGSAVAECVMPHVQALASGSEDTAITFIYVVAPLDAPMVDVKYRKKIETEATGAAADYLKKIVSKSGLKKKASAKIVVGKAADTIIDYASKNKMDLIVMATHGRSGVSRWFYGSVADKIVHEARTPVWQVKPASCHKASYALNRKLRVLVPLDGSQVAESVLKQLKEINRQFPRNKLDIILARVCEIFSPPVGYPPPLSMSWDESIAYEKKRCMAICQDYLSAVQDKLAKAGVKTRTEVPEGNPAEVLIDYINKNSIDLVVLSTHGRTGFSRWAFGSIAEKVLKGSESPVLLIHAK
jgi:nucleotide-binding universal stress UspA family protein